MNDTHHPLTEFPDLSPAPDGAAPAEPLPPADPARQDLAQREQQVARRERALKAREALSRLRLSERYLEHLDLDTDEALERGLCLLERVSREAGTPDIPRAHREGAADYARMSYAQRAALYLQDPAAYRQAFRPDGA